MGKEAAADKSEQAPKEPVTPVWPDERFARLHSALSKYTDSGKPRDNDLKLFGRLGELRQEFKDIYHVAKKEPGYYSDGNYWSRLDIDSDFALVYLFKETLVAACRPYRWDQYTPSQRNSMGSICELMCKQLDVEPPRTVTAFDRLTTVCDAALLNPTYFTVIVLLSFMVMYMFWMFVMLIAACIGVVSFANVQSHSAAWATVILFAAGLSGTSRRTDKWIKTHVFNFSQ